MSDDIAGVDDGYFPELDFTKNQTIKLARRRGFMLYFPSFPSAAAQARNTFDAATKFLADCEKSDSEK